MRGIPAIGWLNFGILSFLIHPSEGLEQPFHRVKACRAVALAKAGPPRKTAAALNILGVVRIIRIGLRPDFDMALNDYLGHRILGHEDVSTTMIYMHVMGQGGCGMKSPLDSL